MGSKNPNIDPFEKFFKESFENYSPNVSGADMNADWSSVQKSISTPSSVTSNSSIGHSSKIMSSLKIAGIALIGASIITAGILLTNSNKKNTVQKIESEEIVLQEDVSINENNITDQKLTLQNTESTDNLNSGIEKNDIYENDVLDEVGQNELTNSIINNEIEKSNIDQVGKDKESNIIGLKTKFSGKIIIKDSVICVGDSFRVIYRNKTKDYVVMKIMNKPFFLSPGYYAYKITKPGKYAVKFELSKGSEEFSLTKSLLVVSMPTAVIKYELTNIPSVSFYNSGKNFDNSKWIFGDHYTSFDQNPVHKYNDTGRFNVKLICSNNNLCFDTVVQQIHIVGFPKFEMPNIITPNEDGINDYYKIDVMGTTYFKLTIVDRYGHVVYSSDDENESWDGRDQETGRYCVSGTYYGFLNYKFAGMENISAKQQAIKLVR